MRYAQVGPKVIGFSDLKRYNLRMEEISVKGEKYVKATILAKKFGYTSDYLGQLCRGEQVKSVLVGRSWYVNEDSLRAHRQGRYRSTSTKSKETLRHMTQDLVSERAGLGARVTARQPRYEQDESELLPPIPDKMPENKAILPESRSAEISKNTQLVSVESPVPVPQPTRRPAAPVLRTIPAYAPPRPPVRTRAPVTSARPRARKRRHATAVLVAAVLAAESLLLFGMLGLEKRMVVSEGAALVLYAFDPTELRQTVFDVWKGTF